MGSNAATARVERSPGASSSPRTSKRSASLSSSSRNSPSAAAKQSNPGPRFAEDAGTRTLTAALIPATGGAPLPEYRALDRAQLGLTRHDRADLLERDIRILQPVTGQHADHPFGAVGTVLQQPG